MSPFRSEVRKLASLSLPVAAAQLSMMMLGFVDTVMVGRVSVEAIGAAALANVWVFGTIMVSNGVVFGIDPLVAQAHGARDGRGAALAFQRGVVLALLFSIPVMGLWLVTEEFLLFTGQDPELARSAQVYIAVQIPSVPFFLVYSALRQYLQGREIMRPAMWVLLIANVFNAAVNWVLIFGHAGFPALGLLGAGIATALTRIVMLLGLALWVRAFRLERGAWVPWSREAVDPAALRIIARIGFPVAIQIAFEIWAFSGAALLAGRLGVVALAAHTIALNMAALTFMVPLGISQGTTTRVGNLIGAGEPRHSQRSAWIALGMGAAVMAAAAFCFVVFRAWLPRIYTSDPDVIALCASILPIAAAFQVFDGVQVVGCGVLRGTGRTRPAAVFNGIGYWVLGLPGGAWLAFVGGWGLAGIWWGLCFGLAVVATSLVTWVHWYGPASLEARALEGRAAPRVVTS